MTEDRRHECLRRVEAAGLLDKSYALERNVLLGSLFRQLGIDEQEDELVLHQLRLRGNDGVRSVLAPEVYRQLCEQAPAWITVGELQNRLAAFGAPMNWYQAHQLAQLLLVLQPNGGGRAVPLGESATITDTLVNHARSLLNADQIGALTDLQRLQSAQGRYAQLRRMVERGDP